MRAQFRRFSFAAVAGTLLLLTSTAIAQPASDDLASATSIAATPFAGFKPDAWAATTAPDEPTPSCIGFGLGEGSLWYRYTATATEELQADTLGSNYDTVLVVWDGAPPAGTEVGCNDDSGPLQSVQRFNAVAGHTYYSQIAFYFSPQPGASLAFHLGPPPPPFAASITIEPIGRASGSSGVIEIAGTITCNRPGFAQLVVYISQSHGRQTAAGIFLQGPCGPQPGRAIARLVGANGRFTPGPVTVLVVGNVGASFFEQITVNASSSVRLQGTSGKDLFIPPPPPP